MGEVQLEQDFLGDQRPASHHGRQQAKAGSDLMGGVGWREHQHDVPGKIILSISSKFGFSAGKEEVRVFLSNNAASQCLQCSC